MLISRPNKLNACSGIYKDWVEVLLTEKCNGRCSWCVEKNGFHPQRHVSCNKLIEVLKRLKQNHVMLLGGEPTLYRDISRLIRCLSEAGKSIYMTTNGSLLSPEYVEHNLKQLSGLNISIHHYNLDRNEAITGVHLLMDKLKESIRLLLLSGCRVRLNCNLISGEIDSIKKVGRYLSFARGLGASVRFAELKNSNEDFVSAGRLFDYKYGTSENPYFCGCSLNCKIDGVDVNIRQMCGFNTNLRMSISNPIQVSHPVLYYNGVLYPCWQIRKGNSMSKKTSIGKKNSKKEEELLKKIKELENELEMLRKITTTNESYCLY